MVFKRKAKKPELTKEEMAVRACDRLLSEEHKRLEARRREAGEDLATACDDLICLGVLEAAVSAVGSRAKRGLRLLVEEAERRGRGEAKRDYYARGRWADSGEKGGKGC